MPKQVEVTGVHENVRALDKAGDLDLERAGTEAARNLLPFVEAGTRVETGRLQSSWEVEKAAFINDVEYSTFQEFGTFAVTPTHAIQKAVEKHEEKITEAFEREQERAARKAGFGS